MFLSGLARLLGVVTDAEVRLGRAEEGDKAGPGPDWLIDLYSPDVNHEMLSVNQI